MAISNGDIYALKVLYSQSLGGGQDEAGVKKSTKRLVVGEITALYADAGIAVNNVGGPSAFGVDKLDFLKLQVVSLNAVFPDAEALQIANYDVVNQKIFIVADEGAGTPVNPDAGHVCVLRFLACGDDAEAPELT
jgi:hypothetical protein